MRPLNIPKIGKAKIALLAVGAIAAVSTIGSTTVGQRFFAQIGISDTFAQTTDAAGRVVQNTSNAVQAFLGRSPGARGATDTLKGKATPKLAQNATGTSGPKPAQRALGKIFDEPLQSLAGPIAPAIPPVFLPLDGESSAASLPAIALPIPVGSGFFAPVVGGGFSGGGFVGGGPGPIGDGVLPPAPPAPPPPIATAVPEPSTWMLLLIGFGAVGASIRRAKAAQISGSRRAGNCVTAS